MNESRTLLGHLRTFLIVTLITVMVWLLAESRMVRTRTLEPQIVLTTIEAAGGASLVVRQATDQVQVRMASVKVEGSTAGLDRFARLLQSRIELRVGREIPAQPGIHTLDLRSILRELSETTVFGLIITEVTPATITVEVDELVTRDYPIRVIMPEGVELDGVPRADPASVRVVAPSSVLAQVEAHEASVQIEADVVAQLAQGRLETIPGVVVSLPGITRDDWSTQIDPGQVDIRVTLRSQAASLTIDRLPVGVLIAPSEIGKWRVIIDDADKDLVNVVVTGPAESIEMLRNGLAVPRAFVTLSFEDLGRGIRSQSAQILGLPPGVRLVSPEFSVNLQIARLDSLELPAVDPAQADPVLAEPTDADATDQ